MKYYMIMRNNNGLMQPFRTFREIKNDDGEITYDYYAFDSTDKADNFIKSVIEKFDVIEKVENQYLKNSWKLYQCGRYCYTIGYVPIIVK